MAQRIDPGVLPADSKVALRTVLGEAAALAGDLRHFPFPQIPDGAKRIQDSVIRPLSNALDARDPGEVTPTGTTPSGTTPTGGTPPPSRLHELALAVTALRARPDAPPEVAEAAATLQDMTLVLATAAGPEHLTACLAELGALQAELPADIQVMTNGPYLITNASDVTDYLGVPVPLRPQLAMCRCGESARKPFCDGSHARVGFSGQKDPKRVPDRRDTYDGVQATIYDNRGICQHSGFCTDRVPGVFKAGREPFVTASGARPDEIMRAARVCPSGALSFGVDGVEEREQVDHRGTRPPAVEISKDGPYRVTGGVPLVDGGGDPVPRNTGVSLEHYALCRCGHSQNKPFCSGMHWYVNFADPPPSEEPTLFEWAGGLPVLLRMTTIFYSKYVPMDEHVGPLFESMRSDHPDRVACWLAEVFGGPRYYTERYGGYSRMLSQHAGKHLTEEQRRRWTQMMYQAGIDAGLPNDAEFKAAFVAYIEWGSRLAVENSQEAAKPPPNMPVPRWWWVCDATPWARVSALAPVEEAEPEAALPGADVQLGYDEHIKALFRQRDRNSMRFVFDLWAYADVQQHAAAILHRLREGTMPCDGPWPSEKVDVFERWVNSGTPE
jgi:CDGSH-type Zn-finger protein/truncated hemoglobin YjbI